MQLSVLGPRYLPSKGDTAHAEFNVLSWADDVATFKGTLSIEYSAAWFRREGSISDLRAMALKAAQRRFA